MLHALSISPTQQLTKYADQAAAFYEVLQPHVISSLSTLFSEDVNRSFFLSDCCMSTTPMQDSNICNSLKVLAVI
jgi:hypothetical protein